MAALWLLEFDGEPPAGAECWRALDDGPHRAYAEADVCPGEGWLALQPLQWLDGRSAGERPTHHYVVETDVAPGHEADFEAWYAQEHLPGLAAVPGTVQARRHRRATAPHHLASYHLTAADMLQSPAWLAVRATPWSDRVRPQFRHTRRRMFVAWEATGAADR